MKKLIWDRLGIAFSSACVVHCIIVAFLPLFFPIFTQYNHSSWVHILVAITILFTSFLAFLPGYRKHGVTWILGTALLGILFIFSGLFLEDMVSDQISHGVSILGSLFLVVAHIKNIQHSHRSQHQHHPRHCC